MSDDLLDASGRPLLDDLRRALPDAPGVYKYFDADGRILYVGKAKSLKKRVNSYFTRGGSLDFKTRVLVRQIADIQTVRTNDDLEALLLENNLIKQYQPKYNMMLKDGKTYPYICIKKEPFPRVFSTRNKIKDGSEYFGPYPSGATMNAILHFIRENYLLRNCNLALTDRNIREGKFRVCLEYHMKNCAGPCVGYQKQADYDSDISQIRHLLRGHYREVLSQLKAQMDEAAANLQFERAHFLKNRIEHVQKHKRRSTVVPETVKDCEVLTVQQAEGLAAVNHFQIRSGTVVGTHSYVMRPKAEETDIEVLEAALGQLLTDEEDLHGRILTNVETEGADLAARFDFRIPQRGDEAKLIELSLKNCAGIIEEKASLTRLRNAESPTLRALKQVQKDLRLTRLPNHIECFDNSNIQGYAPVSSCVVFKEGKPARRDYRVFNVKTVVGIDDFASMKEAVFRRYRRFLEEGTPLPDLIVIDGGKGQLSHAIEALDELGITHKVPIVSIAKRLEEIYYKDDPVPLYIDKKSATLRLLQRIRNEAHNTAITFHRKKRGEKTLRTELKDIKGVGAVTAKKLLTELRSVRRIQEATLDELAQVVGPNKAQIVYDFYHEGGALAAATPAPEPEAQLPPQEDRTPRNPRLPRLNKTSKLAKGPKHKPSEEL